MIRIAKTENGLVRGLEGGDPRITAFKGIPFAAPPVGENPGVRRSLQKIGKGYGMHIVLHRFLCRIRLGVEQIFIAESGMWILKLLWKRIVYT